MQDVRFFKDHKFENAIWFSDETTIGLQLTVLSCGEPALVLFADTFVVESDSDILSPLSAPKNALTLEEMAGFHTETVPLLRAGFMEALDRLQVSAHHRLALAARLEKAVLANGAISVAATDDDPR